MTKYIPFKFDQQYDNETVFDRYTRLNQDFEEAKKIFLERVRYTLVRQNKTAEEIEGFIKVCEQQMEGFKLVMEDYANLFLQHSKHSRHSRHSNDCLLNREQFYFVESMTRVSMFLRNSDQNSIRQLRFFVEKIPGDTMGNWYGLQASLLFILTTSAVAFIICALPATGLAFLSLLMLDFISAPFIAYLVLSSFLAFNSEPIKKELDLIVGKNSLFCSFLEQEDEFLPIKATVMSPIRLM